MRPGPNWAIVARINSTHTGNASIPNRWRVIFTIIGTAIQAATINRIIWGFKLTFSISCFVSSASTAPKPIFVIASIICCGSTLEPSLYSTLPFRVKRFTFTDSTPSTLETTFSTRFTQAAQCIPVISNSCFFLLIVSLPSNRICKDMYTYRNTRHMTINL